MYPKGWERKRHYYKEGGGPVMRFHKIHRRPKYPRRADQSALIGINLSREVRQEARPSVGARVVDERLGAAFIAFRVARGWGWDPVPPRWELGEQDAGDLKGPPRRSAPPSPLRNVMGFS